MVKRQRPSLYFQDSDMCMHSLTDFVMSNQIKHDIKFENIRFYFDDNSFLDNDCDFYMEFFDRTKILKSKDTKLSDGRGKTLIFKHHGRDLVLRHYKRGGIFGKIIEDHFFKFECYAHRARDEFNLLMQMRQLGLKVPKPIIAREVDYGLYLKQDIVIEALNGFKDLSKVIAQRPLTDFEYKLIGQTLKSFFDNNVLHTDLNIRNILLFENEVYLIDFDKCFIKSIDFTCKQKMIDRLQRSFKKEKLKNDKVYFSEYGFEILKQYALV